MEEINHEYYVSIEVAKLLKEAGFDWESHFTCKQQQDEWQQSAFIEVSNSYYDKTIPFSSRTNIVVLPHVTLDVAQRWLREVKNCYLDVMVESDVDDDGNITFDGFTTYYVFIGKPHGLADSDGVIYGNFDTYESALEAGIKKALEIILKK